ncbi:MAG: HAD family phosphatase [Acidobacteriota bacterium]|jgi:beta-phosphoglucomutase|nr:HAD family phosphatase [Acidobacteriota bacterium]
MTNDFTKYGFIFDMDGTLVDNMRFHMRAWTAMLAENGIENDGHDFLFKTAGKTNREIIPQYFEDASEEELVQLGNRKEEIYRELFKPELQAVKGVIGFLEESKKLGIKMAVATAAPIANMEFIFDGLKLRKYFSAITTAADVKNGKPHPEGFLISAEKLGVEPKNCLVFEDAINGFEAAHNAKMKSVGIATVNLIEDILKLSGVVEAKDNFTELKPAELIEKYLPKSKGANL